MGWFIKNYNEKKLRDPNEMSPLECVTYLCAIVQLADGNTNFEERRKWNDAIKSLFPDFLEHRADKFFNDAQKVFNGMKDKEKSKYIPKILSRIEELLDDNQINKLSDSIGKIIEADGIIMTSELEIAKIVEDFLGVEIRINKSI